MRPWWNSSSMLTQRSSVVLPDPLEPMMATTSPVSSARSTPFRTSTSLNFLWRFSILRIGGAIDAISASARQRHAPLRGLAGPFDRVVDQEIDEAGKEIEFQAHEIARDDLLADQQQLGDPDD